MVLVVDKDPVGGGGDCSSDWHRVTGLLHDAASADRDKLVTHIHGPPKAAEVARLLLPELVTRDCALAVCEHEG